MSQLQSQAKKFRQVFNQETLPGFIQSGSIQRNVWIMQQALIREECSEFLAATDAFQKQPKNQDLAVNILKELSDLVFVCYQFAAAYDLDLDEAMDRVFESNMSKLDEQGNVIYREDGKVLKGPNYKSPNLKDLVPPVTTNNV